MPLYNQATTLNAGRGNFAPSVSYYSGIKAPRQPDITLPKATGGFNIDLSRIGDAMIAAKESETKLGLAAVEMEENLRNAERERQLKIDLAELEQDRADARFDKQLAAQWQIAKLNNDTELQKVRLSKQKDIKDITNKLAQNYLGQDSVLRNNYIDFYNNPTKGLEYQTKQWKRISEIAAETGADTTALYDMAIKMGYFKNAGKGLEFAINQENELLKQDATASLNVGTAIAPNVASSSERTRIGSEFIKNIEETNNLLSWKSDPFFNMSSDVQTVINDKINSNVDSVAIALVQSKLTAVSNNMPRGVNPVEYYQSTRDSIVNEVAAAIPSLTRGEVESRVDATLQRSNFYKQLENVSNYAKNNAEYSEKALETMKNTRSIEILNGNNPMLKSMVYGVNMSFLQGASESQKAMLSDMFISPMMGGNVSNYTFTDKNGKEHVGWRYVDTKGGELFFTSEEVAKYAREHNFQTQQAAVYSLSADMLRNTKKALENNTILEEDAVNSFRKNLSTLTGNPDLSGNIAWMDEEQLSSYLKNIQTCAKSKQCTTEDLYSISDAFSNSAYRDETRKSTLAYSAAYKMGLGEGGTGSAATILEQNMHYLVPDNLTGEELARFTGMSLEEHPWLRNTNLKDTVMYYQKDKDGNIVLDYTQNGIFKVGTDELAKRRNNLEQFMIEKGITGDEQLAFYQLIYPNIVEKKDANASWFKDSMTFIQDKTLGTTSKLDTVIASMLGENIASEPITKEDVKAISTLPKDVGEGFIKTAVNTTPLGVMIKVRNNVKTAIKADRPKEEIIPYIVQSIATYTKNKLDSIKNTGKKIEEFWNASKEDVVEFLNRIDEYLDNWNE